MVTLGVCSSQAAFADQWRSIGLEPVILEDFPDAAQIVGELRHVSTDADLAPQQRARAVWDAHAARFDELQAAHADQLAADADELRDALDVGQLNVTLWLADAQGHLARWAAGDRISRSADELRLIDSGHDGLRIAGRALGAEMRCRFREVSEMANGSSNSFQNLGNGTYRVTGAPVSPTTGRYVSVAP